MQIQYETKNLRQPTLDVIEKANEILEEYSAQGFTITLRQLYYQFVARDLIPNNQKEYKKLGDAISSGRRCGLIDWDYLIDRTRFVRKPAQWESPAAILSAVADQYDIDRWEEQDYRPEVWVEKDALVGVVERSCNQWKVPFLSCRGFMSDSEIWSSARRFKAIAKSQTPMIIHLGDHDPSGIDMTRDIRDRLELFANRPIEVLRIALNSDQIQEYNPPPNFAKVTDSRFEAYQAIHGDESWELDALSPDIIDGLINAAIEPLVNMNQWDESQERMEAEREQLQKLSTNWEAVAKFIDKKKS